MPKDSKMDKVKLGQINFINCLPINLPFADEENEVFEIIQGHPTQINELLRNGDIDLAPISSYEYLSNPDKYEILEGISISSKTQADSVLVFANSEDEIKSAKEIFITDKSATSVNLLRIILEKKFSRDLKDIKFSSFTKNSSDHPVKLLIGDEALKEAQQGLVQRSLGEVGSYKYVLDLGTAWYELTGLPMVFALWCFNKDSAVLEHYNEIQTLILAARDFGLSEALPDVIVEAYKQTGLPKATLTKYFQNLDYNFTEKHKESLELFSNFLKSPLKL